MDKAQVLAVLLVAGVFLSTPAVHGHSQSMLRAVVSPKGVIGTSGTSGGGGNFGNVAGTNVIASNGRLECPSGQTVQIWGKDGSAQSPNCVACGSQTQLCCDGSECAAGLQCYIDKNLPQSVCVPGPGYKPGMITKTVDVVTTTVTNGKKVAKTAQVSKSVACGTPGNPCCTGNVCNTGNECKGSTCIASLAGI